MGTNDRSSDLRERRAATFPHKRPNDKDINGPDDSNSFDKRVKPKPLLSRKNASQKQRNSKNNVCHWFGRFVVFVLVVGFTLSIIIRMQQSPSADIQARIMEHRSTVPIGGYAAIGLIGYAHRPRAIFVDESGNKAANEYVLPARKNALEEKNQFIQKKKRTRSSNLHEPFETRDCVAMQPWQKMAFPTCNLVHETNLGPQKSMVLIAGGNFRDVWAFRAWDGRYLVLKTLVYDDEFNWRSYDRHRRDALAMERLTKSKYIPNIYGYCTNSGIFDLSEGKDLDGLLRDVRYGRTNITKIERLRIASQVANGVADAHYTDENGYPTIAHTDIASKQFIPLNGIYKLNDFNRCRFMRWNERKQEPCGFKIAASPGKYRSPEEYKSRNSVLTEKIDVYSMGNILYSILTDKKIWNDVKTFKMQKMVSQGLRPEISLEIRKSTHVVDVTLMRAIEMCFIQIPFARASAKEVADFLATELLKIEAEL